MDENMTKAVCNQDDKKFLYPLQGQLKALSQEPGAYIIGIFDCCREKITKKMRGNSEHPPDNDMDDVNEYMEHVFWFGCQENASVAANSDIAVEFFKEVKRVANPADGSVRLPNDMMFWRSSDGGNMIMSADTNLKLYLKNHIPSIELTPEPKIGRIGKLTQDRDTERGLVPH